ncbi:MAG: hypothetical protein ABIJ12_03175 [bacterium]
MYKYTNIKTVAVIFIMVAMLNLVVGCNNQNIPLSSDGEYESNEDIYSSPIDPETHFELPNPFVLDYGASVKITSIDTTTEYVWFRISYQISGSDPASRKLKVNRTLTSLEMYDVNNVLLYGHNISLNAESNSINTHLWTNNDVFKMTQFEKGLYTIYELNEQVLEVNYASEYDKLRSHWLYETFTIDDLDSLSDEDQVLYQRSADVAAIFNTENSIYNNIDAYISANFSSDYNVRNWFINESEFNTNKAGDCGIIDDIAAVVATISCPFFETGWAALPCIVATGIGFACGSATILDRIFN